MPGDFQTVIYSPEPSGLARLTLNRPDAMNGMTNQMVREATIALEMAAADARVRVLVLTGAGRAFCPGADLNHFTSDWYPGSSPTSAFVRRPRTWSRGCWPSLRRL